MSVLNVPASLTHQTCWLHNYDRTRVPIINKNQPIELQVNRLIDMPRIANAESPVFSLVMAKAPQVFVIDIDLSSTDSSRHSKAASTLNITATTLLNYAKKCTYVEQSFSGTGYHIVFEKDNPDSIFWRSLKRSTPLGISGEILTNTGFCTFTNNMLSTQRPSKLLVLTPSKLCTLLPELTKQLMATSVTPINPTAPITTVTPATPTTPITPTPFASLPKVKLKPRTDSLKPNLDYLRFKLECLAPWPTAAIKTAYVKLITPSHVVQGEQACNQTVDQMYNHYDFWLRIVMAVKDYADVFSISDLDTLSLLDAWSKQDITGSYLDTDTAGLSGFEALSVKYKSIDIKTNGITYKTLDSFLAQGIQQPEDVIKYMNKYHFCIKVGGKYKYGCVPRFNKKDLLVKNNQVNTKLSLMSKSSMTEMYANKKFFMNIDGKRKAINYATYWIDNRERREVSSLVFKPDVRPDKSEHNLWNGFTVGDHKPEYTCTKALDFIKHIIASDDEQVNKYILAWIANIIQHPTVKSNVSLVLISEVQGTGKTFFVNMLGSMFGDSFKLMGHNSTLTNKFNSGYQNKLLVGVEEVVYMHNKSDQSLLKFLITSDTIDIESKGYDVEEKQPNYMRFIFTANNLRSIHIEPTDRRFQVLEVSTDKTNNMAYFGDLDRSWYAGHEREAFFWYMKNYDIKDYDFVKERVDNEITIDQIEESLETHIAWALEWLTDGFNDDFALVDPSFKFLSENELTKHKFYIPDIAKANTNVDRLEQLKFDGPDASIFTHPFKISRKAMIKDYQTYCSNQGVRYPLTPAIFSKRIQALFPFPLLRQQRTVIKTQHALVWHVQGLEHLLEYLNAKLGFNRTPTS